MRAPRSVNLHTLPSQHAKGLRSAGRGISLIKYGHRNPPKDIAFGDGHVHYLHNDYQGSVVLVTDSAGTVLLQHDNDVVAKILDMNGIAYKESLNTVPVYRA